MLTNDEDGGGSWAVVMEIALAAALQAALTQPELTEDEKAIKCREAILQTLKKNAEGGKGRLFFDPKYREAHLKDLCHSVAVEELHACYFERCDLQAKLGVCDRGALFAVYGDRGMGKSYGLRSLLGMRHGRAPRQGYYFARSSIYKAGDEYYKSLLDTCLGRGRKPPLSRYDDIFDPESVALWIVSSLPEWNPKAKGPIERRGILDIPGVSHYFDSEARLPGGAPVVVFDDVNIHLDLENLGSNQAVLMEQLGKAGTFFASIMTAAYQRGVIVFVATSNLLVAKFLHGLNSGKASVFKPVTDAENFECQEFGWTELKRLKFLRLRAGQKDFIVSDDTLQALANDAARRGENIREMDHELAGTTQPIVPGASEESNDNGPLSGCINCTIS